MIRNVRAEVRKLLSIQTWFWLLVAAVALAALVVIVPIATNGVSGPGALHTIVTNGNAAYIAVFILAVLSVTTEYRYQTITPTLLATPNRLQLVGAKLLTFLGVGVVFALVIAVVQTAIAVPWLSAKGVDLAVGGPEGALTAVGEVALVVVLYALIGVGFGALLRNQVVAVVVGLIYLLFLENLIAIIPGVKHVFPFLPGGATASIYSWGRDTATQIPGVTLLPPAVAILVLLAWAVLLAGLGLATSLRRDIT